MKTKIITVCLLIFSFCCKAQYFSSAGILHINQYQNSGSITIKAYNTDYEGNNLVLHNDHTCQICNDGQISKYGSPQSWSKIIGTNLIFTGNTHILFGDSAGNTYYYGRFTAAMQVNGIYTPIVCNVVDSFVFLKFDTVGVAKWHLNKVMRSAFVDYYGNSYISDDTLLTLYNTQGQIQWQRPTAGPYVFADTAYNYYQWDSINLIKYDAAGNVLWQYPAPNKNFYFDKMGTKLYLSSAVVTEINVQTGTVANSWSNTLTGSQKFDSKGNCYAWQSNRFKKGGPTGDWSFMIDSSVTFFDIDKYDNVKHVFSTTQPYRVNELHQFIPPALVVDYYVGVYHYYTNALIAFTISPDDTLQNAIITTGDIPAICSEGKFDVPFTLSNYFVQYKDSGFVVQLSDSTGSFVNPLIIGQGNKSPITCSVPFFNLYGSNYHVRVVSNTMPLITGTANPTPLSVSNASPAYIGTSNGLINTYPCAPVNLVIQPPGHYYCNWYIDDYNDPDIYVPFGNHSSTQLAIGAHTGEHYKVIVTDSLTGCRYQLTSYSFYTGGNVGTMPFVLPDTVCKNAGPIIIKKPTQNGQFLTTAISGNLLFPDSLGYGLNSITYVTFDTVSCYAPSVTKQIFVDSCLYSIKTKTIGDGSKNKFCTGDSIEVSFEYDSTAFPAGTVFYVQFSNSSGNFQAGLNITGSSTFSPIHAVIPMVTFGANNYRYRVISQSPAADGSLNMEGNILIYNIPTVYSFTANGATTNCGTGINQLFIYAQGTYFNWHTDNATYQDTAKYIIQPFGSINANTSGVSNFLATTNGNYWVTVTNEAGCSVTSDTIIILDSAGTVQASLFTLPQGICPGDSVVMHLQTDTLNTVAWSLSSTPFTPVNETLFYINTGGMYSATVTNTVGCKRKFSINVPNLYATTFTLNGLPKTYLCPGDSIRLMPSTTSVNSLQWFENGILQPQLNGQFYVYISDSATYTASAVNNNGCRSVCAPLYVPLIEPVVAQFTSDSVYYCAQPGQFTIEAISTMGVAPYDWILNTPTGTQFISMMSDTLLVPLTNAAQGTYTITLSDFYCASLVTDTLRAFSYTMPSVSLYSPGSTTICIGDSALLLTTFPQADNYLWLLNGTDTLANGSTDSIYAYAQGNYSVIVTNSVCHRLTNLLPIVTPCTVGINDVTIDGNAIDLAPNPADDKLIVAFKRYEKKMQLRITDVAGRIVYDNKMLPLKTEVNTINFSNGMYLLEVNGDKFKSLLKFVVKH